MSVVAHIGHAELLTPELEASRAFFARVLGMREVAADGDSVHLRGYGQYLRTDLKLTAAKRPGLGHLGLRCASAAALTRAAAALPGGAWSDGDVGHGPGYRVRDPAGHTLELYWEAERAERDPRGALGVGVKRIDHVNLFAADVSAARAWAQESLGYRCLDRTLDEDGGESGAWLTTSIAPLELVYVAGAPGRLHHLAFWVDSREEVLRAADVFVDHDVHIEVPPAQHGIGRSFFLYGFEPGGNRIEVTTGAEFAYDPEAPMRTWTAGERARGVGWGTRFPESWRTYGTPQETAA